MATRETLYMNLPGDSDNTYYFPGTTNVIAGAGLTGGGSANSSTGVTIKADLKSETKSTLTAAAKGTTTNREYAVGLDSAGDLSVNVPWTDTKVTSVGNHYTPEADANSALDAEADSNEYAFWNSTDLVTGVHLERDSKGHVTGMSVDSVQMPQNPDTTYSLSGAASGNTWVTTLTPSSGPATRSTVPAATTSAAGLMIASDKVKSNYTNIAYGTCSTAAATAAKVVTISGNTSWTLRAGSIIIVKFTYTNTAEEPTLNVNSTGAKSIWYNNELITDSDLEYAGYANRVATYVYDGAQYVFQGWSFDNNSDTKVTQTVRTTNGYFPMLLRGTSAGTTTTTTTTSFGTAIRANPSNGYISATAFSGNVFVPEDSVAVVSKFYICGPAPDYFDDEGAHSMLVHNTNVYVENDVLMGAAWNDYAEYREATEMIEPGRVVCENNDDTLSLSQERLQPGAEIISDTFGFAIGKTEKCKTPIAAAGRVLAYPYEDRNTYKAGDPVCAGPNGTVSKMTREEIKEYPDRMIGTVSAVPNYETWGAGNVPVNGRIWIRIK